MKWASRLAIILVFSVLLLLMASNDAPSLPKAHTTFGTRNTIDTHILSDGSAPWWDSSFNYRRFINFTEPDVSDRNLVPVHLSLTFENGRCHMDSIRTMYFQDPQWVVIPFQLWNTTYYSGGQFIKSARVSFMANATRAASETNYYIYYAKTDIGSVSYPDFYPFIYKSATFSLINLVSYYDNNNYVVEMWDTTLDVWNDPRIVDARWGAGGVSPTNVPSGTLDEYESIRYEPTATDYSDFWGFYAVYSNYPLSVTMGTGDMNQNPGVSDWYPGVDELGEGVSTKFILGGVEGYEDGNEGKYWIQAQRAETEVYVWTVAETPDSGWKFFNSSDVLSWPAILDAGEYIFKRDVIYTTYMLVNSTKPISVRSGDSDVTYARDCGGYFPSITGKLVGEEFYTIDMGQRKDKTRVTNIGPTAVTVEWWRNDGAGWVKGTDLNIAANGSAYISRGSSSATDPDDILRIKGPARSELFVEGVYDPPKIKDYGDWAPTLTGMRFGTDYRIWGGGGMKFTVIAWENAHVDIMGWNNAQLDIPAGAVDVFMPLSTQHSLYDLVSNSSVSIVFAGLFDTGTEEPSGDQGYGWMVPAYSSQGDEAGFLIAIGAESIQATLEISVVDLDGLPVEDATVTLYNTDNSIWLDGNGFNRSGTTDATGQIAFENLANQTYRIRTSIDAASWLSTSFTNIWVKDTTDQPLAGTVTSVEITLQLADIDIHLEDLMSKSMNDAIDEDTWLGLHNGTGPTGDYIAQALTNETGWVHLDSVPRDSYEAYVSYAGGEGWSYNFEHLDDFGTWTIGSSDFDSGSMVFSNWVVPLISLNIHVASWDDLDVQGASVKIDNAVNPALYRITRTSNITGDFTFNRIVNGTWSVDVSKEDSYAITPTARNNTVTLTNLQSLTSQTIELPLSRLVVRVYTELGAWVENAQVNVSMRGFGLVAQGVTDSSGYVAFFNIHANLSSPYSVSYNLTVQYGTEFNGTVIEILLKCDYDWTYVNVIYVDTPVFGGTYTELSSSEYFINLRWGRDAFFVVDYYKRNETGTFPIQYDGTTWLNFTIYNGVTDIGQGSWNISGFEWIINTTTTGFTITIDSDHWMMGVVEAAYTVVIDAYTNGYDDPTQITVYVNMLPALTSEGVETPAIVEYYETHSPHDFWMYDSTNNENVSGLAVHNYLVKSGLLTVASGALIDNFDGTYAFPSSALSSLEVGSYVITISLKKGNYENLTIVVGATINALPMTLDMYTPSDYDWSLGSESIDFNYTIALNGTATDLQDVTVQIEWINHGTGLVYSTDSTSLDAVGSVFTYSFSANIVPAGEWRVRITATKSNYQSAISTYSVLTVSPAPTLLVVNPITTNVAWTEIAVVQVTFTRVGDGAGLSGALITHNWTAPIIIDYEGLGVYTLYIDTTIPAQVYMLEISASLSNHELDSGSTSITIRVPLKIENDFASDETPLVAYWTRIFDIIVRLLDNSRVNTTIADGTITYYWTIPGGTDQSGPLTNLGGGLYGITLDSDEANILVSDYQISLDATRAGATSASSTVFLMLEDVPNEVILDDIIYLPYYGDIVTISFYWNNTLDNQPVINPVSASFYVEPLGLEIGSYVNYGNGTYTFNVDTSNLGMHEYLYDAFYTVNIVMSANGLEVHPATFAYFLIRETPTRMDVATQYTAEWSEDITVVADIFDTVHNEYVWIGATAILTYGIYAIPMTSLGNGTFFATFNTTTYFTSSATPYDLEIIYSIPDYVDGSVGIEILITPLTADIVIQTSALQDGYHQLDWAETFAFEFALELPSRPGANVPESLAQYSWLGFPSVNGVFSFNPLNYHYSTNIDVGLVIAGLRTLRVTVQLSNHTIAPFDLLVNVTQLVAVLSTESTRIEVFYGADNLDISLSLTYNANSLEADRVFTTWAGITRGGDWDGEEYVFQFNPSYSDLEVPSTHLLNFTAELDNYTVTTLQIPLLILARTQLTGDSVTVEAGDSVVVYFRYWDMRNDRSVPGATVVAILPGSLEEISPDFNGTHYYFAFSPTDLEIRPEAYNIVLTAFAYGYQNYTSTTGGDVASLDLFVREPTYNIPFLGPQPKTLVHGALLLLGIIGFVSASSVAVRRARIPYQIKQINKAIKQIEGGRTAEVDGIKSLETVVSEILSAGLAELDIAPPTVEFIPDEALESLFDEETLSLLSQVDALRALDEPEEVQEEPEVPPVIEEADVLIEDAVPDEAVPEPGVEEVEPVSEPEEVAEPEPLPDLEPVPEPEPKSEPEPIEEIEEELPPVEEAPRTDEPQGEEVIEPEDEIPSIEVVSEVDELLAEEPPESEAEAPPEEEIPPAIEEAPADGEVLDSDELEELDALDESVPKDEPTEIPIDELAPEIIEPDFPDDELIEVDLTPEPEEDAEVDEWEPVIEELRERLTPEIRSSYTKEELDAMSDEELEALIKAIEKAEAEKENGDGS